MRARQLRGGAGLLITLAYIGQASFSSGSSTSTPPLSGADTLPCFNLRRAEGAKVYVDQWQRRSRCLSLAAEVAELGGRKAVDLSVKEKRYLLAFAASGTARASGRRFSSGKQDSICVHTNNRDRVDRCGMCETHTTLKVFDVPHPSLFVWTGSVGNQRAL